jgi:branched-chain amino acid aminotransferase
MTANSSLHRHTDDPSHQAASAAGTQRRVFLDGVILPESEARLSVFDHGLLYGDGVCEGLRVYGGKPFCLREHVAKLFESAKAVLLDIGMSPDGLSAAISDTIKANEMTEGYVRVMVTRGVGPLGLNPGLCSKASVFILAAQYHLYSAEKYSTGLDLVTCATRRPAPAAIAPRIKSLSHLNNVMARLECQHANCEEGIMLNEQGYVADCTAAALFVVKNGVVTTPSVASGALDTVARRTVLNLLVSMGIQVREDVMTRHEIYISSECFLAGTAAEVIPAITLDRRRIGDGKPGPVSQKTQAAFMELARNAS